MKYVQLIIILSAIALAGCQPWTHIKKAKNETVYKNINVALPVGWVQFNPPKHLVLTKDGSGVQNIMVRKFKHEEAFENIEKSSSSALAVSELADLYITNFKKGNEDITVNVKSMKPYKFQNDVEGFEVELELLTKKGLTRVLKVNGAAMDYGLVLFSFDSPKLHYFNRDVTAYDELVKSATL